MKSLSDYLKAPCHLLVEDRAVVLAVFVCFVQSVLANIIAALVSKTAEHSCPRPAGSGKVFDADFVAIKTAGAAAGSAVVTAAVTNR